MIATRPQTLAPTDPRPSVSSRRRVRWTVAAVAVAGTTAFTAIQLVLEASNQRAWVRFLIARNGPDVTRAVIYPRWPDVAAALLVFIGLEASGMVLVARGRRRSFAAPALWWTIVPWFTVTGAFGRAPIPIGPAWTFQWAALIHRPHPLVLAWAGSVLDLALVLAPAVVLLRATGPVTRHRPRPPASAVVAAVAFCAFVLWLILYVRGTAVLSHTAWEELPVLGATFAFGALLGTRWPSVWWLALVPVLMATSWIEVIDQPLPWSAEAFAHSAPWALVAVLGAGWEPLVFAMRWLERRTLTAVVAVNTLNLADALLTAFAVHHAEAVETNPLIRMVGLPAKVLGVGLLSVLLARRSPRALVWPALALLAVLAWHLGGLFLNAHV